MWIAKILDVVHGQVAVPVERAGSWYVWAAADVDGRGFVASCVDQIDVDRLREAAEAVSVAVHARCSDAKTEHDRGPRR
jgi:hypothetical protein